MKTNNESFGKYCNDLEIVLKNGDSKDVNTLEIFYEMCAFQDIFGRIIPIFENLSIFLIILYTIISFS